MLAATHRPSGAPPTAAISLHRREPALRANFLTHAMQRTPAIWMPRFVAHSMWRYICLVLRDFGAPMIEENIRSSDGRIIMVFRSSTSAIVVAVTATVMKPKVSVPEVMASEQARTDPAVRRAASKRGALVAAGCS